MNLAVPCGRSAVIPALCRIFRWWLAVDFETGISICPQHDSVGLRAAGDLAHDLEPHRVGKGAEHRRDLDPGEVGRARIGDGEGVIGGRIG